MNDQKKIVKQIFSPVIKKFPKIQITTHYKDECWSIDLFDKYKSESIIKVLNLFLR